MKRNIAVSVILSIVTCGIYSIYWMIMLNNEVNIASEHPNDTTGGMVFLLSLVTCGIYGIYWAYKMGQKVDEINVKRGGSSSSYGVLFLVLAIFGLEIVDLCLMQDALNKA